MWYKTGTVGVTNGSKAVVGASTLWLSNALSGHAFVGPDGASYEIETVNSDTSIALVDNYAGSTVASGGAYKIMPTQSMTQTLAASVQSLIGGYSSSDVLTDLDNEADVDKGPALVGFNSALAYTAGLGLALRFLQNGASAIYRYYQNKLRNVPIDIEDFGGDAAGSDNTAAMRLALTAAGVVGRRVQLTGENYNFASATLGSTGLSMPSNVTVAGRGRNKVTVTGTAVCNLFMPLANGTNMCVEDLWLYGNSQSTGEGTGTAFQYFLTTAATADVENIGMRRVRMDNFKSTYWATIENQCRGSGGGDAGTTGPYVIRFPFFDDIVGVSYSGNSIAPSDITALSFVLKISGFSGRVYSPSVQRPVMQARYVKGGVAYLAQLIGGSITDPDIRDAGLDGATDDAGAYAILLYDTYGLMQSVSINRPVLANPRSCGIYAAGGKDITVNDPTIFGQTDTVNGTLPKAAIVFNGTQRPKIKGGHLTGNFRDVHAVPTSDAAAPIIGGVIDDLTTSGAARSIFIGYSPFVADTYGWKVVNSTLSASVSCVTTQNSSSYRIHDVVLDNNRCETTGSTGQAIDLYFDSGSSADGIVVSNNQIRAAGGGIYGREITGRVRFLNNDVKASAANNQVLITAFGCTKFEGKDNIARDSTGDGYGFDMRSGTIGTLSGNEAINCAHITIGSGLGDAAPSHSGSAGQFVQNFAPTAGGTFGWACISGTTWKAVALAA